MNRQDLSNLLASVGAESPETKKMFEPSDLVEKWEKQDPNHSKHLVSRFLFYTTLYGSLKTNKQIPPMKMYIKP